MCIVNIARHYYKKKQIKNAEDPEIQNDMMQNHNMIENQIKLRYCFKIFKDVNIIFFFSFFVGHIFFIYADITKYLESDGGTGENFLEKYSLYDKTQAETTITLIYYALTTLSTIGLGDYNPRSNMERIFIIFVLIFGVGSFSYIISNLIDIFDNIKALSKGIEDGDNLRRFYGLIAQFNKGNYL